MLLSYTHDICLAVTCPPACASLLIAEAEVLLRQAEDQRASSSGGAASTPTRQLLPSQMLGGTPADVRGQRGRGVLAAGRQQSNRHAAGQDAVLPCVSARPCHRGALLCSA